MDVLLKDPLKFMMAGKARFTLESSQTKKRFTYRIKKIEARRGPLWFLSVLTGSDNESHFSYAGTLYQTGQSEYMFKWTAKSKVSRDAPSVQAFLWTLRNLNRNVVPDQLNVYHEGRCGRCGRTLTVPESIKSGFGPECIGKVQ